MKKIYFAIADPTLKASYRLIEHHIKEASDFKVLESKDIPEEVLNGKAKICCSGTDYSFLMNPGIKTTKDASKTKYILTPIPDVNHSFACMDVDWVSYIKNRRGDNLDVYSKIFNRVMYLPDSSGFPTDPICGLQWKDIKRLFITPDLPMQSFIFGVNETIEDDTIFINPSAVMFGQNNWKCDDVIEFSEFLRQNHGIGKRMMLNLDVNHMSQFDADIFMMVIGGTSNAWINNELIKKCSPIVRNVYSYSVSIAVQIEGFDQVVRDIRCDCAWRCNPSNQTACKGLYSINSKEAETLLGKYKLIVDCTNHSDDEKSLMMDVLQQHVKQIEEE